MPGPSAKVGVVVIGRNEGERLRVCLKSLDGAAAAAVYVDSGSTDGSVELARRLGFEVVELDTRIPFTAARARNAGYRHLRQLAPTLGYVQFVDGDCEVAEGWIDAAVDWLDKHRDVAVACGRRRERYPRQSIFNLLCDMEWDTPVGEAKACGGDALMRTNAFEAVGGFRDDLIAGEEPELCVRLRAAGWRIWRLGVEMTLHDAAMTRLGQWWQRNLRSGYAYAEGASLHGRSPARHGVRESRSAWIWGIVIPLIVVVLVLWVGVYAIAVLLIYPIQVARLAFRGVRSARENWWRALFLVLAKFPELFGQFRFIYNRTLGRRARLIEYK